MVPEELDEENAVAVQCLDGLPRGRVVTQVVPSLLKLQDPTPNFLVLVHHDRYEGPVPTDRLLDGGDDRLVFDAEMGNQFLLEEPNGLIEDDVVPFARLAGGHHLVQGRLEFRELVDEILVHRDERSERILRRLAHRSRLRPVVLKACASRREPARRPRERYGVSDVVELADPLDEALHPHPEARVLPAAEAAGVAIAPVPRRRPYPFRSALLSCLPAPPPPAALADVVGPPPAAC